MSKKDEHLANAMRVAATINHCPQQYRSWRVHQWAQHIKKMLSEPPNFTRGQGRLL